jgi:toxin ParE1/3/4
MSRKLVFSEQSQRDLIEIWVYISHDSQAAADRVTFELERTCRDLLVHPGLGEACPQFHAGLRRVSCSRYVIYFRSRSDTVEIVRVLHGSRNADDVI